VGSSVTLNLLPAGYDATIDPQCNCSADTETTQPQSKKGELILAIESITLDSYPDGGSSVGFIDNNGWKCEILNNTPAGEYIYTVNLNCAQEYNACPDGWASELSVDEEGKFWKTNNASVEVKITVNETGVYFVSKENKRMPSLRVAKWENAYAPNGELVNSFVDRDPDNFSIRVNDYSKAGIGTLSVGISTSLESMTEIEVDEYPENSGVFYSSNLILVSDDDDDDHTFNDSILPVDDQKNDKTHKAKLGDKVEIRYPFSGTQIAKYEASVPVDKTVDVRVIILRDTNGNPVISSPKVSTFMEIASRCYAQVGVKILWDGPLERTSPINVDNGILLEDTNATPRVLNSGTRGLISSHGTKDKSQPITVFYVGGAISRGTQPGLAGVAIMKLNYGNQNSEYTSNVFLINDDSNDLYAGYLLAHELGHILTDLDHPSGVVPQTWIMRGSGFYYSHGVKNSKRFTSMDDAAIKANQDF
jgi:hypothetical protein